MKSILFFSMFIILSFLSYAQKDRLVYQYMLYKPLLNYAASTVSRDIEFSIGIQKQWVGLNGSPEVGQFIINVPIKKSTNLGLIYEGEKIGAHQRNTVKVAYAYGFFVSKKAKLSFSLSGRLDNQNTNMQSLYKVTLTEALANTSYNVWNPNFDFGTFFHTKKVYIGLNVSSLLKDSWDFAASRSNVTFDPSSIIYRAHSGYKVSFKNNNSLNISLLLQTSKSIPINADFNLGYDVREKFGIGVSYRSVKEIVPIVYLKMKQFSFSYAYAYNLSKIRTATSGSHELFLKYTIASKKTYYTIFCPRF